MSKRDWAWEEFEQDRDTVAVERAVVADFADWVREEIETTQHLAEYTGNSQVALGIELALEAMRKMADGWMGGDP